MWMVVVARGYDGHENGLGRWFSTIQFNGNRSDAIYQTIIGLNASRVRTHHAYCILIRAIDLCIESTEIPIILRFSDFAYNKYGRHAVWFILNDIALECANVSNKFRMIWWHTLYVLIGRRRALWLLWNGSLTYETATKTTTTTAAKNETKKQRAMSLIDQLL